MTVRAERGERVVAGGAWESSWSEFRERRRLSGLSWSRINGRPSGETSTTDRPVPQSISMKMHSPGHFSAASIAWRWSRLGTLGEAPGAARIVEQLADLGHVGDAVLELDEHVRAVIEAQAVAGAQVLVDPHPHERHATGQRRWTGGLVPFAAVPDPPEPSCRRSECRTSGSVPTGPVEDPGRGCATGTTRTPSPTSRPRTRTPTPGCDQGPSDRRDLRRDQGTNAGDGPVGAGPSRPVVVRHADRRGARLPDPLSRRERRGGGPSTVHPRPEREAGGRRVLRARRLRCEPGPRLVSRGHPTATERCFTLRFRDLDAERRSRRRARGHLLLDRVVGRQPPSLLPCPTRPCGPTRCGGTELGTPQADDVLVHQEDDERFIVDLELTRAASGTSCSPTSRRRRTCSCSRSTDPWDSPALVTPREPELEYRLDHWGDRFVILTNLDAAGLPGGHRAAVRPGVLDRPRRPRAGPRINQVEAFDGYLVLHEWGRPASGYASGLLTDGAGRVQFFDDGALGRPRRRIPSTRRRCCGSATSRWSRRPPSTTRTSSPGNAGCASRCRCSAVDPSRYRSARDLGEGGDGTPVPVDTVWHEDTPLDGTAALSLYGYGAYELASRRGSPSRACHCSTAAWCGRSPIRGRWRARPALVPGRQAAGQAQHVHRLHRRRRAPRGRGYGSPDRVAIAVAVPADCWSAPALERPDLYAGVVAEVPFVDVVTTMRDPSIPLTVGEWEEWGDPRRSPARRTCSATRRTTTSSRRGYPRCTSRPA